MKIETLKERIEKKQAQIERKSNTIIKKEKQIAKKQAELEKLDADSSEARWIKSDISWLQEDIKRGTGEIEECKATLSKYEKQLAGELEKEATFIKEVPQAMKDCEKMLVDRWDEADKKRRAFLQKEYKKLGYEAFIKKHHYSGYEYRYIEDEAIHSANEKDARYFILDLLNRVKDITGEVTDWSHIYLEQGNTFPVLNGFVTGKEGKAEVESILAGGYNIQRLHIRTLVKAI